MFEPGPIYRLFDKGFAADKLMSRADADGSMSVQPLCVIQSGTAVPSQTGP